MTNREAVIAALQIAGYSDSAIDKALLDLAISGTATYASTLKLNIDLVALEVLQGMLSVSSVSEGGYSVSYSIEGVKARIAFLQGRNGLVGGPTVKAVNVW